MWLFCLGEVHDSSIVVQAPMIPQKTPSPPMAPLKKSPGVMSAIEFTNSPYLIFSSFPSSFIPIDNYQTSIISCSARRAFIIVDDSLPEALLTGIWENVFKVRGIVFEDDNDEDNDESWWDGIGEEK